ncbi:E3 ubiquitin ligase [Marasmius sp. AFHP31]|nr:E3 ubiquitin ligase [Marasmius sp. AFHP31]KAK1233626.1 E3 ubiquitin ligase [Marasmius sp. AFHP31]
MKEDKAVHSPSSLTRPRETKKIEVVYISSDDEEAASTVKGQDQHAMLRNRFQKLKEESRKLKEDMEVRQHQYDGLVEKYAKAKKDLWVCQAGYVKLSKKGAQARKDLEGAKKIMSRVERAVRCAACTGIMKNPKVIVECGHTFCGECLDEWRKASKGKLTCPTCRKSSIYPPPKNMTVQDIAEEVLNFQAKGLDVEVL